MQHFIVIANNNNNTGCTRCTSSQSTNTHNSCIFNCGKCPPHTLHTCQICLATNSHRTANCPNRVQQTRVVHVQQGFQVVQVTQPTIVVQRTGWNPGNRAQVYGILPSWRC
jgi:hypothetical protein